VQWIAAKTLLELIEITIHSLPAVCETRLRQLSGAAAISEPCNWNFQFILHISLLLSVVSVTCSWKHPNAPEIEGKVTSVAINSKSLE
jgi:hypothetical protein